MILLIEIDNSYLLHNAVLFLEHIGIFYCRVRDDTPRQVDNNNMFIIAVNGEHTTEIIFNFSSIYLYLKTHYTFTFTKEQFIENK